MRKLLSLVSIAIAAVNVNGDLRLPAIFSDHMVLQRQERTPVWGWTEPGDTVTVSLGDRSETAKVGPDGKWMVRFKDLKVGDGQVMTVETGKGAAVRVEDVLVGEVWVCSGQSNMEMGMSIVENAGSEIAAANYPRLRLFSVNNACAVKPATECEGKWTVCTPGTVRKFSAVAYFFGSELLKKLDVPVGLIESSWGGTPIEAWTSLDALAKVEGYGEMTDLLRKPLPGRWDGAAAAKNYRQRLAAWEKAVPKAKAEKRKPPRKPREPTDPRFDKDVPGNLFNAMINPLVPYAIRGAVWYQGETNAVNAGAEIYDVLLDTLIRDWRGRWGSEFPFAWVQLPEFQPRNEHGERGWIIVREKMLDALRIPKTGMAVTLGLGDAENVHPIKKRGVGERLARWALADVYGRSDVTWTGPRMTGHKVGDGSVTVAFSGAKGGLRSKDGGPLKGFLIAGEDRQWREADAELKGNSVVVSSPDVPNPVAVRYAWKANPEFSLLDASGLPASPFRTDDWPFPHKKPLKRGKEVPVIRVPRRVGAPRIDGVLDDAFWKGVPSHELKSLKTGGKPAIPTLFKLAWSEKDASLCVAIQCVEPDPDGMAITAIGLGDGNIWWGDCVEFLFETDAHSYYQITANPGGGFVDLDRETGIQPLWASNAEFAASVGDDVWTLELRIPAKAPDEKGVNQLEGVVGSEPTTKTPWFVNVIRQRIRPDETESSALTASKTGGIHDVESFYEIVVEGK